MRICFVSPSTKGGGAERMQLNIMHSLSKEKYEITFINTGLDEKPQDLKNNIHYIQYNKKNTRKSFFRLSNDLKRLSPEYVFTTSIVVAYLLQLVRFIFRLQYKLYVRIAVPPSESVHTNFKSRVLRLINSLTLKYVDTIIAQTEFSKSDIAKHYRVSLSKIQVIRNIIDKEMLNKKGMEFNPSEILSVNYNIVAAGALYSVKGFDLLIDAMRHIIIVKPDVKLYILGDERYEIGYKIQLQKQISENKLDEHVFLLGYKSNPYPYFKKADLFVLSSRTEGFPNVVLEALYYGTPVVATNCVDFSGVIKEGINGYVVEKESVAEIKKGVINAIDNLKRLQVSNLDNFNYETLFVPIPTLRKK